MIDKMWGSKLELGISLFSLALFTGGNFKDIGYPHDGRADKNLIRMTVVSIRILIRAETCKSFSHRPPL